MSINEIALSRKYSKKNKRAKSRTLLVYYVYLRIYYYSKTSASSSSRTKYTGDKSSRLAKENY